MKKLLILGDCHSPYHDPDAWALAMKVARTFKPDVLVQVGDFLDLYTVSSHSRDPGRALNIQQELDVSLGLMQEVYDLKVPEVWFLRGNHETRLERYLQSNAPELSSLRSLKLENLMHMKDFGFKWLPYWQPLRLGKLAIVHDAERSGVTAHHKAEEAYQSSVVIGHSHQLALSFRGNVWGNRHVCGMAGWLGSAPAADYLSRTNRERFWQHGLLAGLLLPNRNVHLEACPMVDGTVMVAGKLITADKKWKKQ